MAEQIVMELCRNVMTSICIRERATYCMGIAVNKDQDKWASLLNKMKRLACQRSKDIECFPGLLIPLTGVLRVTAFLCSVAAVGIAQGRHLGVG